MTTERRAEIEKRAQFITAGGGYSYDQLRQDYTDLLAALSSSESKIAKAVEALERCAKPHDAYGHYRGIESYKKECDACNRQDIALTTLAEIKEQTR